MGLAREASQNMNPPPVLVHDSGERDLSDQLLETWMLLEYCDQGKPGVCCPRGPLPARLCERSLQACVELLDDVA